MKQPVKVPTGDALDQAFTACDVSAGNTTSGELMAQDTAHKTEQLP
jgi:hypothetical protein